MEIKHTRLNIEPQYIFLMNGNVLKVQKILNKCVIINDCTIKLNTNIITDIFIDKNSCHANCDPKSGRFCSCLLYGQEYNKHDIESKLKMCLSQYNMVNAYNYDAMSYIEWI